MGNSRTTENPCAEPLLEISPQNAIGTTLRVSLKTPALEQMSGGVQARSPQFGRGTRHKPSESSTDELDDAAGFVDDDVG